METRNHILVISSIITFIVSCSVGITLAQENYYFKTFTTENGLPHNTIKGLIQDREGFLWVATWDGLSRYDGYEFRNYFHNPADSSSLQYFSADQVEVDCADQVWVRCGNMGVSLYERSNDHFINFPEDHFVANITLDPEKRLWLLRNQDIKKWDYQARRFDPVNTNLDTYNFGNKQYIFYELNFDNKGGIWLIYSTNELRSFLLYCDDISQQRLNFKFLGEFSKELINYTFYNVRGSIQPLFSASGNFWIANNYGVYLLDRTKGSFKLWKGEIPSSEFDGVSPEYRKKLLAKIHYSNANYFFVKQNLEPEAKFIESFCVDRQETIWLSLLKNGSEKTGLIRCMPTPNWFRHYFFEQNTQGKLNAIFPVLKDSHGSLWAGPQNLNCIFRRAPDGKVIRTNQLNPKLWDEAKYPRTMLEDSAGIWIGYFGHLLLYYDFAEKKYSIKILKKNVPYNTALPDNFIHIAHDDGDLILFGYQSIYRYQPKSGKVILFRLFDATVGLYSYLKDKNGDWWLGFGHGKLLHFDKDFQLIRTYSIGQAMFNIETICEGKNNDLWLALLGGGLARFDKITGKYEIFSTANGLSNNTCYGILKDSKGNLWISTNHGISRFNPETKHFRTFGPSDGLKIDEFNSDATFQTHDGEMFFGGMGGVVGFYPDSINESENANLLQHITITDFKVSGMPRFFHKALHEMDTVSLKKGEDNFQLSFAYIDFKNADKIKYRYRLNAIDKAFTETDHLHRFVNYANLTPGNYTLEIEATNREGEWGSRTILTIIIPPIYYQTLWFKLLVLFILLAIVALFLVMYNQQIRTKASRKQAELRLESLRGQMNPHFIFNSLNSINYFISQNDRLSANRYISDFSRLIRSFLGNLSKEFIPFEDELESLNDYLQLEHLRFSDKFDYNIEISDNFDTEAKMIFPGMVQPFIENAIWHGVRGAVNRKGNVIIKFLAGEGDYCKCIIEDDGVGRKLSESRKNIVPGRKSSGIAIVTERLRIINQIRHSNFQLTVEDLYPDQEETGTRVTIDIPTG